MKYAIDKLPDGGFLVERATHADGGRVAVAAYPTFDEAVAYVRSKMVPEPQEAITRYFKLPVI